MIFLLDYTSPKGTRNLACIHGEGKGSNDVTKLLSENLRRGIKVHDVTVIPGCRAATLPSPPVNGWAVH